ncbi:substrate-binding domain-containing protein [Cohnella ginsengisoli]|uniref:Substrate-binding domain-containing protein n=1 Tax=Cohnella ginsengisoli TaxID=425004 RepID=A0A9X4QME0_9BACL|nr:substrate-binding domain-containing protein [Cohnella ginsengisoli]MDG0791839.1 substrate-binding domain-containing protein [Cohnella ginsengisoli]
MKRSVAVVLSVILASVLALTACGKSESSTGSGSAGNPDKIKPIVVGVSNGYIGNGWRTQMTEDIEKLAEDYKQKGWIEKIIVQHAGLDVNNQIAQIRNMINAKVDLLLIDPNSETALNPIIEEAVKKRHQGDHLRPAGDDAEVDQCRHRSSAVR